MKSLSELVVLVSYATFQIITLQSNGGDQAASFSAIPDRDASPLRDMDDAFDQLGEQFSQHIDAIEEIASMVSAVKLGAAHVDKATTFVLLYMPKSKEFINKLTTTFQDHAESFDVFMSLSDVGRGVSREARTVLTDTVAEHISRHPAAVVVLDNPTPGMLPVFHRCWDTDGWLRGSDGTNGAEDPPQEVRCGRSTFLITIELPQEVQAQIQATQKHVDEARIASRWFKNAITDNDQKSFEKENLALLRRISLLDYIS
eukprot:m.42882 g.42882  ORF g.42882 m.42882 type:complete len:258 (-) comp19241_c0_seq1:47-820(-)